MDNPCYSCVEYDGAACDWCKRNEYGAYRGIETLALSTPAVTNYDLLISKTPEEMAKFLAVLSDPKWHIDGNIFDMMVPKESSWLSWLKSPVEVDDGT